MLFIHWRDRPRRGIGQPARELSSLHVRGVFVSATGRVNLFCFLRRCGLKLTEM